MKNINETAIDELTRMSRFAGERFDLVQAGGGNASVKTQAGLMIITASGFSLGDVAPGCGLAEVHYELLIEMLDEFMLSKHPDRKDFERFAVSALERVAVSGSLRSSIETFMHSVLGKCVLHTHPLTATAVASRDGWREVLGATFPDAVLVEYHTPGIELAHAVIREIKKRGVDAAGEHLVVFLENHGLIVSGSDISDVIETTDYVATALESASGITTERFRITNAVSGYVNEVSGTQYVCGEAADAGLLRIAAAHPELLYEPPFRPDTVVYNGFMPLNIESLDDYDVLKAYLDKYGEPPRTVIYRGRIFFVATNMRAVRDMESILKFHLLVLAGKGQKMKPLREDEIMYLGGWEAEKHRRDI